MRESDFTNLLRVHQECLFDEKKFRAILSDLFPTDVQMNNILVNLFHLGLPRELEEVENVNDPIYFKYGEITDQYINKLRLYLSEDDDLIEKQSKLLFWKQVNYLLDEWSIYKYCAFLCDTFPVIKEQIKYVPSPKPTITKRFDAEERAIEEELAESNLPDAPKSFEYLCSPRPREINTNEKKANGQLIVRHDDRRINALVKANFACEIDENHPTVKSK